MVLSLFNDKTNKEIQKMYNFFDTKCLNHLVWIDKEINRVISLIKNYLYLPEELIDLENTLFLDYILYPHILLYINRFTKDKTMTVYKAVIALRGLMSESSEIITSEGYAGVGRFLVGATNKKFEDILNGDYYDEEISIKKQLYINNANSIHSAEFQARFEDGDVLAEYIGIGYENFIARAVKFQSDNGYAIFEAEHTLAIVEIELRSGECGEILLSVMNCRNKNSRSYREKYPYIKGMIDALLCAERDFTLCNYKEGRDKARLYINILNSALKR